MMIWDIPGFDDQFSDQFDSTLTMANSWAVFLRDSVVMVNNEMRNLMVRFQQWSKSRIFLKIR
ncbi:MAG: hypothetical protein CM1200mP10_17340 [Candidatus Neomarinimicrobiota bacterium]|nr:MAG: hypothetical protein CM1200mP10_17340 [Candidatus Neomarinimicrobiota bacterium]